MSDGDARGAHRKSISTGTLLVLGFGVFLFVGWFAYRPYIPPAWLHSLSSDIALRAVVPTDAPPPEDIREATPRGLADSPYICAANVVPLAWDHLIAVAPKQDVRKHPVLRKAKWTSESLDVVAERLMRDERYQLIVLLENNTVLDARIFFTFWGDLSGISRPEGYTRDEAVFTAVSKDGVYVLSPATDVPPHACEKRES
jgi:hypothetical protein